MGTGFMLALLSLLLLAAVAEDLRHHRIPNVVALGGTMLALLFQGLLQGMHGLSFALTGWAVGAALLFPGYLLGATGAGDVKLMGAVGAFLGPETALVAATLSMVAGGLIAIAVAMLRPGRVGPWARYGLMVRTLVTTGRASYVAPQEGEAMARRLPFAVGIAAGTVAAVAWTGGFAPLLSLLGVA